MLSPSMQTPPSLQTLLEREVSRKEFLSYLGAVLIGVIGIGRLLRLAETQHMPMPGKPQRRSIGYGASTYGEARRTK